MDVSDGVWEYDQKGHGSPTYTGIWLAVIHMGVSDGVWEHYQKGHGSPTYTGIWLAVIYMDVSDLGLRARPKRPWISYIYWNVARGN